VPAGDKVKHRPFHSYTMKQAIDERFILDVLKNYTPVDSYYRLIKKVEDDPEFDTKKAQKKLRRYVESHQHAIAEKAEIMVDHFHQQVLSRNKIGGKARAMVVTGSVRRAIDYFYAFNVYLKERKSPHKAIVAFSGEHDHGGKKVTEASLNGFSSNLIVERIREEPYRFLICAEKFQTGYDEPLLHTMYVDKPLSGIKAVQTLSRLNRSHPKKYDTFVLDFQNHSDTIQKAFEPYYRTTILSEETDPNKLNDLKASLDSYQVFSAEDVGELITLYLGNADRDRLDPILDACVAIYIDSLDEDQQVDFKGKAKAFVRTYGFLASILPFGNPEWEKHSTFLNFLIPKLPAPKETDLSKGILEAIDMDSYRVEVRAGLAIALADQDAEIEPVPTSGGGFIPETELDRLSNILRAFNDQFGNIDWKDADKIRQVIAEEIPAKVAADKAYQNAMKHSDKQNARLEHDKALQRVLIELLADHTELYKQFSDNPAFKRWLAETIFSVTYSSSPVAEAVPDQSGMRFVQPRPEDRFVTSVPFIPLKIAAGAFSDPQHVDDKNWEWVEIQAKHRLRPGMFVSQVVGKSMEPAIPDRSYCLFAAPVEGPRQGKTLLVQLRDTIDPETGERYTVKRYESDKITEDDSWSHSKITLKPVNPEFEAIVLTDAQEGQVKVIAECIEVLGSSA